MAKTIKVMFDSSGSTLELMYDEDGDEAYVTVQRKGDLEDEEHVAILEPTEALELAKELIEFGTMALKNLSRYAGDTDPD